MTSIIRTWHLHSEGAPHPTLATRSACPGLPHWKTPCVHVLQEGLCPELRCSPSLWLSLEFHEDQARPCISPPSEEKRGSSPSFPALRPVPCSVQDWRVQSGRVRSAQPLADEGCHALRRRYRSVYLLGQFPKGESHESCSNKIRIIRPSSKGENKVSQERSRLFPPLRSVRASGFLKITGLFIDPIFPGSVDFPLSPSALEPTSTVT